MTVRSRNVHRDTRPPSMLERRFADLWHKAGGPPLEAEFRFHPQRRWRADFAHLPSRTLIEIEGGIYVNGRHNRAAGFAADLEKYLEAALGGWRVVRLCPGLLNPSVVSRLAELVQSSGCCSDASGLETDDSRPSNLSMKAATTWKFSRSQ